MSIKIYNYNLLLQPNITFIKGGTHKNSLLRSNHHSVVLPQVIKMLPIVRAIN